ncbi:MAG: hydrolase, partial [Ignavibacteriae bacterium]|nr:hydrolase [Ignavibacteriota bacterium]
MDADLLVFPEMTLTGFTMNSEKHAETTDGISFQYFSKLASRLGKDIFTGIIEKKESKFYNSLVHFDCKGLVTNIYRKTHPFSFANEDKYFSAGNDIVVTNIGDVKIGLTVCYDLRFPELYRLYAKEKVDVIINIANWPSVRVEHWKHLLKARAIENQCFIVGVNRVGVDGKANDYNGCSSVFNPMGKEIVLVENDEKIIQLEINVAEVNETRTKFRFLDDMKLI